MNDLEPVHDFHSNLANLILLVLSLEKCDSRLARDCLALADMSVLRTALRRANPDHQAREMWRLRDVLSHLEAVGKGWN
jgi:hypothetical protein